MNDVTPPMGPPHSVVRLALVVEGALAVLACLLGLFMDRPPWERMDWGWRSLGLGLAAAAPMLVGLVVMRQVRYGPVGKLNRVVDEMLVPLFGGCTTAQLAAVSVVAGVGEEMLFRGVVQPQLIAWWGVAAGLAVTSVVFGLMHAITVAYAVVATAVGAYFGWLAIATEGLVAPMVTHAAYDFAALVYLLRSRDPLGATASPSPPPEGEGVIGEREIPPA